VAITDADWDEVEVVRSNGVTTFFGIDASYETDRRAALEKIFAEGRACFVCFPHEDPPPYYVSIYACRDEDAEDVDMVSVGTAWLQDRLPNLPELLLAIAEWPPTSGLVLHGKWSERPEVREVLSTLGHQEKT
jgi:hypothetical protein